MADETQAGSGQATTVAPALLTHIFALRTTANREDQVLDFVASHVKKKNLEVYALMRPHGMRGYVFVEARDAQSADLAAQGVPYARGILPKEVGYKEIEHMLEQVKRDVDIRKGDIVEVISGIFKREQAKISRVDKAKGEVVVEFLGAAVPVPLTVKLDAVKVIRRESEPEPGEKTTEELMDD
ncbi:MAG: transcription elongation factor Spt5 [Candidatus Woesearchaeota archaeon]|nr:transcription elongation factor Spt5 [Candidatus Woesearchaeota archaeon]